VQFRFDAFDPLDPSSRDRAATWLDRAEIAVVRVGYAGRVSRQLRIDGLTIREPPPAAR
jgi:hypothetical protein